LLSKVHDDTQQAAIQEGVSVADDVGMHQFLQHGDFGGGFCPVLFGHGGDIDLLQDAAFSGLVPHQPAAAEAALAHHLNPFVGCHEIRGYGES